MKWNEYRPQWKAYADRFHIRGDHGAAVDGLGTLFEHSNATHTLQRTQELFRHESAWISDGRPYYDLYQSVIEPFTKIDLGQVGADQVRLPVKQLLVRLPPGGDEKITTIFAAESVRGDGTGILLCVQEPRPPLVNGIPFYATLRMMKYSDDAFDEAVERKREEWGELGDIGFEWAMVQRAMKIVATLCLLRDNPDLIEPQVLECDREKYERTGDLALVEKAIRRGKRAWAIGRHIECAPGFRRPHFAIRWMGKGRTTPTLRPISGCLVRKKQIMEVPTGYLDDVEESANTAQSD